MGCWCHGDRLLQGIQVVLSAAVENGRETPLGLFSGDLRPVQTDVVRLLLPHAPEQGAADLIARRQIGSGQVCNRALTYGIHQASSLATNGF